MMRGARLTVALAISVAIAAAIAQWSSRQDRWVRRDLVSSDGRMTIELALNADGPIRGWVLTSTPTLSVRCTAGGSIEYSVTTRLPAAAEPGSGRTVRYGFDESTPVIATWAESANRHTLSAPAEAVPALLDRLSKARRFTLAYIPFNAEPALAAFSVSGFQRHWTAAQPSCGS